MGTPLYIFFVIPFILVIWASICIISSAHKLNSTRKDTQAISKKLEEIKEILRNQHSA